MILSAVMLDWRGDKFEHARIGAPAHRIGMAVDKVFQRRIQPQEFADRMAWAAVAKAVLAGLDMPVAPQ
jgi:hypothetical protein